MSPDDTPPPPHGAPTLQVAQLGKSYGALRALGDVSLTLDPGERLVILGAPGCGRSALLRCVAGIEPFGEGEVLLNGAPRPRDGRAGDTRIALIAPETELPRQASLLQACAATPAAEGKARVALAPVGLGDAAGMAVATLGRGQQRRAAIARALLHDPAVLLLDEPTSGLDPDEAAAMRAALALLADAGVAMICTTDDLALARRIAQRVVFMDRGRVVETGSAAQFLAGPQSGRAQTYLAALGQPDTARPAASRGPR